MFISFFLCLHFFSFFLKQLLSVSHGMFSRTRNRICSCSYGWGNNSVSSTININVHLRFKYVSHKGYNKKLNGTNPLKQFSFFLVHNWTTFPSSLSCGLGHVTHFSQWNVSRASVILLFSFLACQLAHYKRSSGGSWGPMEGGPLARSIPWIIISGTEPCPSPFPPHYTHTMPSVMTTRSKPLSSCCSWELSQWWHSLFNKLSKPSF